MNNSINLGTTENTGTALLVPAENVTKAVLAELSRLRKELLAGASPEFRATAQLLSSLLQQPETKITARERQKILDYLGKGTERLRRPFAATRRILAYGNGSMNPVNSCCQITDLVQSIIHELQDIEQRHRVQVRIAASLPTLNIDSRQIGRVISGLVQNTMKNSPDGSRVVIKISKSRNRVKISIVDQGTGIPFSLQGKKSERRIQASHLMSGLMSLSFREFLTYRRIIKSQGGEIRAKSRAWRGPCLSFSFSLPIISPR